MAKDARPQGAGFERARAKIEDEVDHSGPLLLGENDTMQEAYARYERAVEVATKEYLRCCCNYVRRLGADLDTVKVACRPVADGPHARRTEVAVEIQALEPGGKIARKFEFVTHF